MNQQRLAYKQEISAILRREEKRLMEMEYLEVRLTELSFVAIEIEDLQKELKENQQVHAKELSKAQTSQQATSQKLQVLHEHVDQVMKQQAEALDILSKSTAAGTGDSNTLVARPEQPEDADIQKLKGKLQDQERLHQLEQQLAQRDEELLKTRQELYAYQQRVQELERGSSVFVENKHSQSDTESTEPLSQRSS
jgi:mevalonate kinase